MRRRHWLLGSAALGGTGLYGLAKLNASNMTRGADWRPPPSEGSHPFTVQVDIAEQGGAVQRGLLGQNLQWVDGGDDLLDRNGNWRAPMLTKAIALYPTSLRYPGGAQSDTYHWSRGMGPVASRGENLHFHRRQLQATLMGTLEFLELCEACGAEPFITVNVVTGTAQEAAAWVQATNVAGLDSRRTGRRLPKVQYWEVGNEPYLQEGDKSLWLTPAAYIDKARAFIRAMRTVDPQIRIGLPLRTATIGGLAATPYPTFAAEVLSGVVEPIDFLGLHNAYMPYLYDGVSDADSIYWGLMGATATVERNLADTRALIAAQRPGAALPFAITEYNGFFTQGKGSTDDLVASPATALYVADLLCMLARQDDVVLAHYWSLSGNWKFGAVASTGTLRPGYEVLKLLSQAFRGHRLHCTLDAQRFDAPKVGAVVAQTGLPLVTALATREARQLRVLLINKDRHRPAEGKIEIRGARLQRAERIDLASVNPMTTADEPAAMVPRQALLVSEGHTLSITMQPASVVLLSVGV